MTPEQREDLAVLLGDLILEIRGLRGQVLAERMRRLRAEGRVLAYTPSASGR